MSGENSRKDFEEMDFGNPKSGLTKLSQSALSKWTQLTKNPKFIGALFLVGLVVWALIFTLRSQRLQEREELGRVRMNLIQLQQALLVPSEIIYYDPFRNQKDLAEARAKGYEFYGVESILPYNRPFEHMNGSLEQWWINHSGHACGQLISEIENEKGFGNYLKQNPSLFNKHIRPLIVRKLDSVWPLSRRGACGVLLAMGDRSEEVLEILKLTDYSGIRGDSSAPIFEKYGINPVAVDEDESIRDNLSAWKRTHEIVKELKKKYPLKPETVIRDWESYCFDGKE